MSLLKAFVRGTHTTGDQGSIVVTVIQADHLATEAIQDLLNGLRKHEVWTSLALHEIRHRFRRSILGPFWLTLSMGIMVGALGVVFSTVLQQELSDIVPYIAVGLIFWGLLASVINEGTMAFIGNESYIRNVPLPVSVHFYRMLARNLIILVFNMAIYLVVLVWFRIMPGWHLLVAIPGLVLFVLNAAWFGLAAGILSTRFRDIPQVVSNLVQLIFFVTPVFWSPALLPSRPAFAEFNPIFHLIEVVREPLLGNDVSLQSWGWALACAVIGLPATLLLYRRAYARIAYWV